MPKLVEIDLNPSFKPSNEGEKAAMAAIKGKTLKVEYITAMENIRNSGGLYRIVPAAQVAQPSEGPRRLEDYTNDELKLTMISVGIVPQKQMKRPEIIKAIRLKLDGVEIADEGDGTEPG